MNIIPNFCTVCGGKIKLTEGERLTFCPWCGTQLFFDDGSITINVNQNIRDEARLRELHLQERELQLQEQSQTVDREHEQEEVAVRQKVGRVLFKIGVLMLIAATVLIGIMVLWKPFVSLIIITVVLLSCGIPFAVNGGKMANDKRTASQRYKDKLEKQRRRTELAMLRAEEERAREEREYAEEQREYARECREEARERSRRKRKKEKGINPIAGVVGVGLAAAIIKKILK